MTFALLLACFFLSGFSALLYETAWTREFAFVFGTSELAVVAVLAAYMGGLALGAALAARWAPRIRRPVLAYGVLELAIALWAIALPYAIRAVSAVYLGWLGGLDALPETLGVATHAFHLIGAFAVLVPCTALMGATLPLLARHAVTRDEQIGPRVGLLYAVNTAGAIGGTLAAAFVLLPALGLRDTVYVGAAINALVFAAAAGLARVAGPPGGAAVAPAKGLPWILPAIAVSGAVSFGYEVLWFRMLGQVMGGSTAAFSTMLASFLAGIALGSALAARFARTRRAAATGFVLAQLATAAAAGSGFRAADRLPELAAALGASVNALGPAAWLAIAMLLPLTLCVGTTFPFAVRLLARDAEEATASSARVYAWNTLGSIVGAVVTGYVLLPALGLVGTLVTGAALNLALALVASLATRPPRRALAAAAVVGAALLAALPPARPDALLRASPLGNGYEGPFRFLAIGRSSTVALIDVGMTWRLTTNGLPEAVILPEDYPSAHSAAAWLSLLPALVRPGIEDMLIIGLGAGMTVAAAPSTLRAVDVIELEPEVVAANRAVAERAGGDLFADPRLSLRFGDARGALTLTRHRYDAIVSQPSHPWTSGASHLYTREFFELVRSRLGEGGVFVQWIGAPFVDLERLRSLVASLVDVFANVQVYRPMGGSIVMVASDAPFDLLRSVPQALARAPDDFGREGIHVVEDVLAALALDAEGTRRFSAGARLNTDDTNLLATSGLPSSGRPGPWVDAAFAPHDPLPALADRIDVARLARRLQAIGRGPRLPALAASLDAPERQLALAWQAIEAQRPAGARRHLEELLAGDPAHREGRSALALVDPEAAIDDLPERVAAVIHARRHSREGLETARALDGALAAWRPGELFYPEAAELRVRWRHALGDPRDAADALELLDPLLARVLLPRHVLLRAELAVRLGQTGRAWRTLAALDNALSARAAPEIAGQAVALALTLGPPPDPRLVERLRGRAQTRARAALRSGRAGSGET